MHIQISPGFGVTLRSDRLNEALFLFDLTVVRLTMIHSSIRGDYYDPMLQYANMTKHSYLIVSLFEVNSQLSWVGSGPKVMHKIFTVLILMCINGSQPQLTTCN